MVLRACVKIGFFDALTLKRIVLLSFELSIFGFAGVAFGLVALTAVRFTVLILQSASFFLDFASAFGCFRVIASNASLMLA